MIIQQYNLSFDMYILNIHNCLLLSRNQKQVFINFALFFLQKQISEEAALIGEKSTNPQSNVEELVKQAHNLRKSIKKLLNEV